MFIEEAIATLGIPGSIAVVIVVIFAVLQLIGELIEISGKVAPTFLKLRKILKRRAERNNEISTTLQEVKTLLSDVNKHYSADNIAKRDEWMKWVNDRAVVYDSKVEELIELRSTLNDIAVALADNTKTTDNLYKESCRTTIINFSHLAANPLNIISEEEFRRVQKVYEEYERFLEERNEPNGQVETCYGVIQKAYAERLKTNNFLEYMRDRH